MNGITVETGLALTQQILGQSKLTKVQEAVFRGVWTKQSYQEIINSAAEHGSFYSLGYLKNAGSELWQALTDALGERVTKTNLAEMLHRYQQQLSPPQFNQQDWGDAPDVSVFYGRSQELATLKQWVVQDNCRLVAILGMGGMGKTSLSVKLAQQVAAGEPSSTQSRQNGYHQDGYHQTKYHQNGYSRNGHSQNGHSSSTPAFEYVIWRSLRNAPPLEELLTDWIKFLSQQQEVEQPATLDGLLSRLRYYLQKHRCLLILDNLEALLKGSSYTGEYHPGYEAYGQLLEQVGKTSHQSCLVLTSREKPTVLAQLEGKTRPVRSFDLRGLTLTEAKKIFEEVGEFEAVEEDWQALVHLYSGNPLGLEMVAKYIHNIFLGSIHEFLQLGSPIFDDLLKVLSVHFARLSTEEQEIVYWLAINREPISMATLREDILDPIAQSKLPNTLQSLQRRWAVERSDGGFTLQPVLMEYVTYRLITQIIEELTTGKLDLFNRFAVQKAQAKDYIRQTQARLILTPLIDLLLMRWGGQKNVEYQFRQLLEAQRTEAPLRPGYLGGNVINLLRAMNADLSHLDCSYLAIWQADLQGTKLHGANFSYAQFSNTVFSRTFGTVLSVDFSPSGEMLATSNANGEIHLWRVADGQCLLTCKGHTNWVRCTKFSPDGQWLASASDDQTIRIWDTQTGDCVRILTTEQNCAFFAAVFSPDGTLLANSGADERIRIWDWQNGICIKELIGHVGWTMSPCFSPDGKRLVSGGIDCTIRIWDVESGECLHCLQGHENWAKVLFHPDGQHVVSSSLDQTLRIWDARTGECLHLLQGHKGWIWGIDISLDGQYIASGSEDRTIKIWNMQGQCLRTIQGHTEQLWRVCFHPDGQRLASCGEDGTVRLWKVQDGQCLKVIRGFSHCVRSVLFDCNGERLVSAGKDQQIRIWDVATRQLLYPLEGHRNSVLSVSLSPDGRTLASSSEDQTIKIWDLHRQACLQTLKGHTGGIWSVSFSPDGTRLASGSFDQTIRIWDAQTGACLQVIAGYVAKTGLISFSPDGNYLAAASSDSQIRILNLTDSSLSYDLTGHTNWGRTAIFSPNGQMLATGSIDTTVRLWDLSTRQCIKVLQGHKGWVLAASFSPDNRWLASASCDHTVKIWDVLSGDCVSTLEGHNNWVWSVAFSPDGELLASSGEEGWINLWNWQTGERLDTLYAKKLYEGMNLTAATGLTPAQRVALTVLGSVEHLEAALPSN